MPLLSCRGDSYSCPVGQRAFVLTDPAAYAEFVDYIGLFDDHFFPMVVLDQCRSELDRFFRGGAMLLADDAGDTFCKGEAPILVKEGMADLEYMFFGHLKRLDSPCRANLTAEGAIKFTVPYPGNKLW